MATNMTGADWPLVTGTDGTITTASTPELAIGWMEQFILSTPGTRPYRPDWGANLSRGEHFEPQDNIERVAIKKRIRNAEKYLPVIIDRVEFEDLDFGKLKVRVIFHIVGTQEQLLTVEVVK